MSTRLEVPLGKAFEQGRLQILVSLPSHNRPDVCQEAIDRFEVERGIPLASDYRLRLLARVTYSYTKSLTELSTICGVAKDEVQPLFRMPPLEEDLQKCISLARETEQAVIASKVQHMKEIWNDMFSEKKRTTVSHLSNLADIEEQRKAGKTNVQIAAILKMSLNTIDVYCRELILAGRIEALGPPPPSSTEVESFDNKVKHLRLTHPEMTAAKIALQLSKPGSPVGEIRVRKSILRLLKRNEIHAKWGSHRPQPTDQS